jgi:hypothetical protein
MSGGKTRGNTTGTAVCQRVFLACRQAAAAAAEQRMTIAIKTIFMALAMVMTINVSKLAQLLSDIFTPEFSSSLETIFKTLTVDMLVKKKTTFCLSSYVCCRIDLHLFEINDIMKLSSNGALTVAHNREYLHKWHGHFVDRVVRVKKWSEMTDR